MREADKTASLFQCGNCLAIYSHAAIRMKVYEEKDLAGAPATFKSAAAGALTKKFGSKVTIRVAPEVAPCALDEFLYHRERCLQSGGWNVV